MRTITSFIDIKQNNAYTTFHHETVLFPNSLVTQRYRKSIFVSSSIRLCRPFSANAR